jgi:dihydroflavonol-4-reductase
MGTPANERFVDTGRRGENAVTIVESDAGATTVLVTGGSGFIGSWCVVELLRRGYKVRATVRNLAREPDVRAMIAKEVDAQDRLSFAEADLKDDGGWHDAAAGCAYILHVASPMPIGEYRGQPVLAPARDGTLRVLRAGLAAGARRIVVTSSTAAAQPKPGEPSDETVWTDLPDKPIHNYPRSKTLAEQAAWAFAKEHKIELSTVLPAMVLGPVLGSDYSASVDVIGFMLRGKMPLVPRIGYNIVDVRDLAVLHVLAMTRPEAAGERYFGSGDFLWMSDMARILCERLGPEAAKVSTRGLPDVIVRFGGLFNDVLRQLSPALGIRTDHSSGKARQELGWEPRPAQDIVVDTARSLIRERLI